MPKQNKQKLSSIIKNNLFMVGQIAKYTPSYFFWMVVDGVVWGFINSMSAFFTYNLLNTVSEGSNFPYALKLILMMATFLLLAYGFNEIHAFIINTGLRHKLHLKMHEQLFKKARTLDLACFDDPEFYNDFVFSMNESDKRATAIMDDTNKLINRIVASSSLFGLLINIDPVIAIILFFSSCVTVISNLIGNKINFQHNKEGNPLWRKRNYINRVFHLSDYAKELRISKADDLLIREYDANNESMIKMNKRYGKKYFIFYGLGWNTMGQITMYTMLLYMVWQLKLGSLEIGGFAATVSVVWNIRWMFSSLIEYLTKYPAHSLYVEQYREFLKFVPEITGGKTEIPEFESLEFKNVSFSYEFASHPKYKFRNKNKKTPAADKTYHALKNVSFKINAGDKIAIVGYNGAGKTTLIKLMMRLYDPTEGEILYNGVNIKEYDAECFRKTIGTVFQDYKLFAASIAQNVMNGKYDEATDKNTVLSALDAADFTAKLSTLKDGIDTHLTREFNEQGTNLSGGESQKVAIARVFATDYPIVIMDEPSSALDPMAEYNLNRSILKHTDDKTVVFISHRLSTTRIADKIYMFARGELIEQGSHEELLESNGQYAEMFRVQSEKYKENYGA